MSCIAPRPSSPSPTMPCRRTTATGRSPIRWRARRSRLLERNCADFGIDYLRLDGPDQGIVHVIGPEQGFTLPGMTLVCGDSHTSTHGAFGALAFGIGASECGTVMATQALWQTKARDGCASTFAGALAPGVTAKDMALALIGRIGAAGARRPCDRIRRRGGARAVDGGAHDAVQHGDRGGIAHRPGRARRRPPSPISRAGRWRRRARHGTQRWRHWRTLASDPDARVRPRDRDRRRDARAAGDLGHQPRPGDRGRRRAARSRDRWRTARRAPKLEKALAYMGLAPGTAARRASRSTTSSSAAAPTAGSRICAPPRRDRAAARSPPA